MAGFLSKYLTPSECGVVPFCSRQLARFDCVRRGIDRYLTCKQRSRKKMVGIQEQASNKYF
jgi:hypothetical protein